MELIKKSNDKIGFTYKGASLFATGNFGRVLTYSIALLFILIGIAAFSNVLNNNSSQSYKKILS